MESKSERRLRASTSKTVLRQLEENQSLRIENFRLRTDLRDQHHHFKNSTVNQEMLLEKMLTELSLAFRRCKDPKKHNQQHQILSNVVKHCIGDLQSLLEAFERNRNEWRKTEQEDASAYYEHLLDDCSQRFDEAEEVIQKLCNEKDKFCKENELKNERIEFLQGELGKIQLRYEDSAQENARLKQQNNKLSEFIMESQQRLNNYNEQISKLKTSNDELTIQLRQSREVANKHAEYVHNKCQAIEKENEKLISLQRGTSLKEQQFHQIIQEYEKEIHNLSEEVRRLKLQVQSSQAKIKQIIEKEEKIKLLQTLRFKRVEQRPALSEIPSTQNTIDSQQSRPLKREVGKMTKKFNLQSFQQKLSSSSSSATFYPH